MLIDINAGMAEHLYRREKLSKLYPKRRTPRATRAKSYNRRNQPPSPVELNLAAEKIIADLDPGWLSRSPSQTSQPEDGGRETRDPSTLNSLAARFRTWRRKRRDRRGRSARQISVG